MNKAASLYKAVVLLWHITALLENPYYCACTWLLEYRFAQRSKKKVKHPFTRALVTNSSPDTAIFSMSPPFLSFPGQLVRGFSPSATWTRSHSHRTRLPFSPLVIHASIFFFITHRVRSAFPTFSAFFLVLVDSSHQLSPTRALSLSHFRPAEK